MEDLSERVIATARVESLWYAKHFIYFNLFNPYDKILWGRYYQPIHFTDGVTES